MKIGDKVKITSYTHSMVDQEGVITSPYHYSEPVWNVCMNSGGVTSIEEKDLTLIENKKMSQINIKEKFTLAFKSEPEKSFRKTGITNGDDFLTDDGQHIFLSWLLKKHGADFKTEVVDDLLKEAEEEKK